MPKILDVSKDKILGLTDKILTTEGYKALSVRRIAAISGMATGTFYLYFPSKEELVAQTVLKTWTATLNDMRNVCSSSADFAQGVMYIYSSVRAFYNRYAQAFKEYSKYVGSLDVLNTRHIMLRKQLSGCISALARSSGQQRLEQNSDMFAECVLAVIDQEDITEDMLRDFINLTIK